LADTSRRSSSFNIDDTLLEHARRLTGLEERRDKRIEARIVDEPRRRVRWGNTAKNGEAEAIGEGGA